MITLNLLGIKIQYLSLCLFSSWFSCLSEDWCTHSWLVEAVDTHIHSRGLSLVLSLSVFVFQCTGVLLALCLGSRLMFGSGSHYWEWGRDFRSLEGEGERSSEVTPGWWTQLGQGSFKTGLPERKDTKTEERGFEIFFFGEIMTRAFQHNRCDVLVVNGEKHSDSESTPFTLTHKRNYSSLIALIAVFCEHLNTTEKDSKKQQAGLI